MPELPPPALLLLHGALGSSAQFAAVVPLLQKRYQVHTLDFEGHGHRPTQRPFRMEHFAENILEYLDQQALPAAHCFGYSMGGYVALYLASQQPERVQSVQTLGTKLAWTPEVAAQEIRLLDPAKIRAKVPRFAQELEARHPALGWEPVLAQTADLLLHLGQNPLLSLATLAALQCPVLIGVGDRDTTVTLEEAATAYRTLPQGALGVWPNTPHPLEKIPPPQLAYAISEFIG